MKQKFLIGLALVSLSSLVWASSPAQDSPDVIEFLDVVSVQPQVITDAQCADAFSGKIRLPANFRDYSSKKLDIVNRVSHKKEVTDDLGMFVWTEKVTMHLADGRDLTSPAFVTALYVDRRHFTKLGLIAKTNGHDGVFVSYYCQGRVHKQ